jgi:hypothetical protein
MPKGEKFTALAHLPTAGATAPVEIRLDGVSSEQDVQRLRGLLADSGPDAVIRALERMPSLGKISTTGTIGFYDFKVVRSTPTANGRRIVAVADRPIGFLESYYNTRSTDYRFGILRLDLEGSGDDEKGTGELIYAAKVKIDDDGSVDVENFNFAPVRLLGVHRQS